MCNTNNELLSLQMPLASQKKSGLPLAKRGRSGEVTKIPWHRGPARQEVLSFRVKNTVRTQGSHEVGLLKKERNKEGEQFNTSADFQFGTSAMVPSNFEGLVGYSTLFESFWLCFWQASVCIAHMACPCHPYIPTL